jgi:hypothetical protein
MLMWDEWRTGGIIAVVALITGVFALGWIRLDASFGQWHYIWSPVNWHYIGNSVMGGTVTPALVLAVSLVFGLGNSGNMSGGFSNRVLRLPVATRVAVAVALVMRTTLLVALLLALHWLSLRWFGNAPPLEYSVFVVEAYLLLQLLDWTRTVVSGLVTFVFLPLAAILFTIALRLGRSEIVDLVRNGSLFQPLTAVILLAGVYVLGVPLVHAVRTGRRWGAPELWEWPRRLPWPTFIGAARFSTPQAALMWSDWRRVSCYLLLIFVGLIFLPAAPLLLGVVIPEAQSLNPPQSPFLLLRYLPGMALLAACLVAGLIGALKRHGTAGYPYVLPVTVQDIARARLMANGRVFVPLLGVMALCSFATGLLGGGRPLALFLETWRAGELYPQDIVWFFMAPVVGAGLIGWAALTITSRLIVGYIVACVASMLLLIFLRDIPGGISPVYVGGVLALPLWAWVDTWRRGLVTGRTVAKAGLWWIALSILVLPRDPLNVHADAGTLLEAAALGALGPLPFVALLRGIARMRHGGLPKRRPRGAVFCDEKRAASQGQTRPLLRRWVSPALLGRLTYFSAKIPSVASPNPIVIPSLRGISVTPSTRARWIAVIIALVFLAWLKWPAEPAFMGTWRAQGYPATEEDINNAQPSVPDAQNKVHAYLGVKEQLAARHAAFAREFATPQEREAYLEDVLCLDDCPPALEPIGERSWARTRAYHTQVVEPIVPALRDLAGREDMAVSWAMREDPWSRYQEEDVTTLQGALQMDALVHAMENDPAGAAASLHAFLALSEVWSTRPYSGWTAGDELAESLEQVLSRAELSDPLLVDLSRDFDAAIAGVPRERILAEGRVRHMEVLRQVYEHDFGSTAPALWQLAAPAAWDAALLMRMHGIVLETDDQLSVESAGRAEEEAARRFPAFFVGHSASELAYWPDAFKDEEMRRMIARIALATERYRLAFGYFPERITDLMPQHLEERDLVFFEKPLECRVTPEGVFEVYIQAPAKRPVVSVLFRLPPPVAREAARRIVPDSPAAVDGPEAQEGGQGV